MFRFRGQRKDNGEWVVGAFLQEQLNRTNCYIYDYNETKWVQIHYMTLSISTGKLDSNDQEIFASFEIDGVMTTGGDVVDCNGIKYDVFYNSILSYFMIKSVKHTLPIGETYTIGNISIIGKQGGGNE